MTLFDKIVVALVAPTSTPGKSCLSGDSVKACGSAALDLPWAWVLKDAKLIKCNSFVPGTEGFGPKPSPRTGVSRRQRISCPSPEKTVFAKLEIKHRK
ncbi:hypothetical protein ACF06V_00165 [Streptomyces bobili]|uniref:hypothetical protein n=1 Tax=Streptomyces bobili TaxID=67280 RepID=UPI0036F4E5CB